MINQDSRRDHSDLSCRLTDHGQPGSQKRGPIKIIEAEEADFFGTREPDLLDRGERTHCHHVVGAKNRGGALSTGQKPHGMEMAALHVVVAVVNHRAVRSNFRPAKRAEKSLESFDGCAARGITRDDSDMAVPEAE